jgi:phosphatidylglycerol---prolipoprotein diacylglyceryl transferase
MYPIIFTFPESIPLIGGASIYTYGVLVATAFLIGVQWTLHEAKIAGFDVSKIADLTFYVVVAAIVGSRILYILVEWERYLDRPLDIFKLWEGGLVFYGGLLGGIAMVWYYVRRQGWSMAAISDLYMPSLALGHAIGRLGCLMAGCCYGRPVDGDPWWALHFPHLEKTLAPGGIGLYPTQLMESFFELLIFFLLVYIRRGKKFSGQIFLTYLLVYAFARSFLEIFRGDSVRGFVIPGWLSTSQFISLMVMIVGVYLYWRNWKKSSAS